MATTSFELGNKQTATAVRHLQGVYGVGSMAATLKRALAIALVMARNADDDGNIQLIDKRPGQGDRVVLIPQRF